MHAMMLTVAEQECCSHDVQLLTAAMMAHCWCCCTVTVCLLVHRDVQLLTSALPLLFSTTGRLLLQLLPASDCTRLQELHEVQMGS